MLEPLIARRTDGKGRRGVDGLPSDLALGDGLSSDLALGDDLASDFERRGGETYPSSEESLPSPGSSPPNINRACVFFF